MKEKDLFNIIRSKSLRFYHLTDKSKVDCGLLMLLLQQVVSYGERRLSDQHRGFRSVSALTLGDGGRV